MRLVEELQLKECSRYKKIEEKSVEAKFSAIAHRRWVDGRKTSCGRVATKCPLRVI
jgi:hypothetical protein